VKAEKIFFLSTKLLLYNQHYFTTLLAIITCVCSSMTKIPLQCSQKTAKPPFKADKDAIFKS